MLQYHCLQCQRDSPLQVHQGSQLHSIIKVQWALHKLFWHSAVPAVYGDWELVEWPTLEVRQKVTLFPAAPLFAATSFDHHWPKCLAMPWHLSPWCPGLSPTSSIFPPFGIFTFFFPPFFFLRPVFLFENLYFPSSLLSGPPNPLFSQSEQSIC